MAQLELAIFQVNAASFLRYVEMCGRL